MILIHASCVAIEGIGVLIRGGSGAGKSDLALRLIDDGAMLVSDDYCEVIEEGDGLIATAPALIAGKMEVRGFGIASVPFVPRAVIGLVVDLAPWGEIPRMPDVNTCNIAGVTLPWLTIDPATISAAAKVRLVLGQAARTPSRRTAAGA
jgi:serine kinase of HPr protein (carbohydrate metabolism regulator)